MELLKVSTKEIVFWLLVLFLIGYGIGKALGYIQSPELVEASPFVVTGILIAYLRLYMAKDIKSALDESLKEFKKEFDDIRGKTLKITAQGELLIDLLKNNLKQKGKKYAN